MIGLNRMAANMQFNARVLTIFGNLNEQDVEDINGCSKRLVL